MFVATAKLKNGKTSVRLVHSFRKDGKSKKKIIKTIGQSKEPEGIKRLKALAWSLKKELEKKGVSVPFYFGPSLSYIRGKGQINEGVQDILGAAWKHLNLDHLICGTKKDKQWSEILKSCVFMRFLEPSSKLRAVQLIQDRFQKTFSHNQILRMMDHLSKQENKIKERLFEAARKESRSLELLLFDVTTLYFENVSQTDLKQFGFSKDNKFNEVQVVLALLTDGQGLPLTYEIFPGNTAETKTLIDCLNKLKVRHSLKRLRLTADKAMYSKENLSYFEERKGYEYIVACPLRKLPGKLKERILDKRNYRIVEEGRGFFEFSHDGGMVYVGYCLKRAERERDKMARLLEKVRKMANWCGEDVADRLSGQRGISRYLEKVKAYVRIKESRIEEEERWDGIFGVCSNVKTLTGKELFASYKRLWKIEESFRINKHTLRMRPIYHQLSRRIRSHIMMCFLTYTLLRWIETYLKGKGLVYGPQKLIDILSDIETWQVEDERTGEKYRIPKELSREGAVVYKAFGIKRRLIPDRVLSSNGS